ncbi:MAG: NAD(P)H-dependent oxidoreductase [Candidatus Omnitrophica bacterium]|nr:NAD(P)H-dependent oxidoreductase [Candidatus Omnitrophota bacterium]
MRVAIISYSFSGNTKRACLFLMKTIKDKNIDAMSFDLKPENEEKAFLKQCKSAFYRQRVNIQKTAPDIGSYDFIIFASPVWAFTFAPALRVYLESIKDLTDKKCGCFLTYGSGLGKNKALTELEGILKAKGGRILFSKNIPGAKTGDKEYLAEQFKSLIDIIGT